MAYLKLTPEISSLQLHCNCTAIATPDFGLRAIGNASTPDPLQIRTRAPTPVHVTVAEVTVVLRYGDSEDAGRDAGHRQCG